MKSRFFLIIIMLIVLFGGWLYVGYEHALSQQAKLDDISRLPIYAYVADTTLVAGLMQELKAVPAIKSVVHETASQAAAELITAYGLSLNEEMIKDYSFPDVITLTFLPKTQALTSKAVVLDILRAKLPEADIDSQSSAYNNLVSELSQIRRRSLSFNLFAFVLMVLIFIFSRQSIELHSLLHYAGKKHSVVDKIRHQKQGVEHTLVMLLIPLPVCVAVYFALTYLIPLPRLLPYWVFLLQLGSALLGTLVTYFTLHTFEQEVGYMEHPVQVLTPSTSNLEDNSDTPNT